MLKKIEYRVKKFALEKGDFYPYRRYMTNNKCIFVHIPKAAGTSVLQALSGKEAHIQRDHCNLREFRSANRELYNEYFKFAFVRHPLDRIHSSYRYLMGGGNKMGNLSLSKYLIEKHYTFNSFVNDYLNNEKILTQVLFKPQFSFFCNEFLEPQLDFLGKYENINNDFEVVRKKVGLKQKLKNVNVSKVKSSIDIDNRAAEKIYSLYKTDFELFNYDI